MSLWGDIAAAATAIPTGGASYWLKDSMDRTNSPANPEAPGASQSNAAYNPKNKSISDLVRGRFGDATPYRGTVTKGYNQLGQPGTGADLGNVTETFITNLASVFADKVFEKTGNLPTIEQLNEFVAENATAGNASKFITGSLNEDQIGTISKYYIQSNPDITAPATVPKVPSTYDIGQGTNRALEESNKIYDQVQTQAIDANRRAFAPLRSRAAEEEAALGRLRSPVSAAPESAINQVDVNEGNSLSGIIGNILGQKASNTLDFSKFNETLGAGERRAGEATTQFNQNLANQKNQFNRTLLSSQDEMDYNRGLNDRMFSLSEMLGKAQAKGKERDWLDYLNAGVGVVGTGAKLFATKGA